jgi:polyhydroxyalkanoate synthase
MPPDPAEPARRRGAPSPLAFHLAAALQAYQQAMLAAPRAHDPRFPWADALRPAADALPEIDPLVLGGAVAARLAATLRGIELWQSHPYRRHMPEPPTIWTRGAARLLDYGRAPEASRPDGPTLLVVPSLINRAYVLDLLPERSLLRWLAGRGFRPVMLDWGEPGPEERRFDLAAYGRERLAPALSHLREETGRPVAVVGYCMGGTLAAALAARGEGVARLAVIGAPWDFSASAGIAGSLRSMLRANGPEALERQLDALGEAFGAIPVMLFQALFALVNPLQAALKFQRLARLDPAGPAATLFVALEDWLNDGVPMAPQAARDLLVDWQIRNTTGRGAWEFLGRPVRPEDVRVPTIAFCGRIDSIAPPSLALPLAQRIPGARLETPSTGHVGMIVGSAARAQVWRPLADFLSPLGG